MIARRALLAAAWAVAGVVVGGPSPGSRAAEPPTVSEAWFAAAAEARFEQLTPDVRRHLVLALADALGVVAYTREVEETRRYAALGSDRGPAEATELVSGARVNRETAAAINAFAIHGAEIDDSNLRNQLRASCVAIPAPLAWAEASRASGRELLLALAVSYDLADRLATLTNRQPAGELHRRGWMPSSVCGAVGSAAATATLAGLPRDRWASAVALAAGDAGGTFQYYAEGTDEKRIHVARSQALACQSVRLAEQGFRGARASLEGPAGLLVALGFGGSAAPLAEKLGTWDGVRHVKPKFFACSQGVIPWLETLDTLRRGRAFAAADVAEIVLALDVPLDTLYARRINQFRAPTSLVEAQLSVNYTVALWLTRGGAFVDDFLPERLAHPEILALAGRVRGEHDSRRAGTVVVRLADGTVLEARYDPATLAAPYEPREEDYRAKFARLTSRLGPERGAALWEHATSLEQADDVAVWVARLSELIGNSAR